MKFRVVNTVTGLVPETDSDYEAKRKLKIGASYEITIKEMRNAKFHRLYFALLNCAWEYLTDSQREFFHNSQEVFRKSVEVSAGHCDKIYSVARREWFDIPKSIAFDKLTESDFSSLYEKVREVLFQVFIPEEERDNFSEQLKYF